VIRKLIKLAIFLLIANAVYRIAPVSVHYFQFKDALNELALFQMNSMSTDAELTDRIMALADEHNVPLERDYIQIHRPNGQLIIDAEYVESIPLLPGYTYDHEFDVHAKAFDAR
jgi:putative aminopeptidase FrvX